MEFVVTWLEADRRDESKERDEIEVVCSLKDALGAALNAACAEDS